MLTWEEKAVNHQRCFSTSAIAAASNFYVFCFTFSALMFPNIIQRLPQDKMNNGDWALRLSSCRFPITYESSFSQVWTKRGEELGREKWGGVFRWLPGNHGRPWWPVKRAFFVITPTTCMRTQTISWHDWITENFTLLIQKVTWLTLPGKHTEPVSQFTN